MADLPPADLPLDPEPVLAWRAWRLERRDDALRLVSLTRDDVWPPREAMRARCLRHRDTPVVGCACGLYAASTLKDLAGAGVFSFDVAAVGPVAMWGTVVEHARGARASKAYPARLRLVCGRCLAEGRGGVAPVSVWEDGPRITPACRRHARGTEGTRTAAALQAELLSTYAVDLLPAEHLMRLRRPWVRRHGATSPSEGPLTAILVFVIKAIGAVFQAFMAFWILSAMISVALGVLGAVADVVVGDDDSGGVTAPTPEVQAIPRWVPATVSPDRKGESSEVVALRLGPPPPAIAIPCGVGDGRRVRLLPCRDERADLFGFAREAPPEGPRADCLLGWTAYTAGETFSICWNAYSGVDPDVRPWPLAPDPFARAERRTTHTQGRDTEEE